MPGRADRCRTAARPRTSFALSTPVTRVPSKRKLCFGFSVTLRGVGHRQRRGDFGELAVRRAAIAGRVAHGARSRVVSSGRRHVPVLARPRRRASRAPSRRRGAASRNSSGSTASRRRTAGRTSPASMIDWRTVDVLQSASSSSATIIGSDVFTPCPTSGFFANSTILPSGWICTYGFASNDAPRRSAAPALARALRRMRHREHEPAAREARELDETAAAQLAASARALRVQLLHELAADRRSSRTSVSSRSSRPRCGSPCECACTCRSGRGSRPCRGRCRRRSASDCVRATPSRASSGPAWQ